MIQVKSIEIEGFCSIVKPFSYNFDIPGINLIWGKNGAGKSTIFNALTWVLSGKLIKQKRSIEPWKKLQGKNFNGTMVKVKLYRESDGYYTITRCKGVKGFKDLKLVKPGLVEFPGRNKAEIQKEIEKMLGVSFELFKASVTFGQNLTRFLKLSSGDQKEILDEAFAINYINEARDNAKKVRDTLLVELSNEQIRFDKIKSGFKTNNENLKKLEFLKNNFEADKRNRLKEIRAELNLIRPKVYGFEMELEKRSRLLKLIKEKEEYIKKLEVEMKAVRDLENEIFTEDFEISNTEANLRELKHKRKEAKIRLAKPLSKCFTCGQEINKEMREQQRDDLKIEIRDLSNEITRFIGIIEHRRANLDLLNRKVEKLSGIKNKYDDAQKILKNSNDENLRMGNIPENLKSAKKNKNQLIRKLRETLRSVFGYKMEKERKTILDLKIRMATALDKYKKIKKQVKLHDWVINDPLSNKGIKAYIFNLMIQKINLKLNEYGKKIGFGIKLSIDLESANKTFNAQITKGNDVISYDDLSGGEEQLVDACLAFSMHDVISNNRFNILLLDEVFESLDKDNIDLIYEIIAFKSKASNIHLISHRKSFISRANAVLEL